MAPTAQVWSTELTLPVSAGVRRVSLLPVPDGSLLVVDSTGAGTYGQIVLGVLRPMRDGGFRAHDPHGADVGHGPLGHERAADLVAVLFEQHPARWEFLDCGVQDERETCSTPIPERC